MEEKEKELKNVIKKTITGLWFLFLMLSAGILVKYILEWTWIQTMIDLSIIMFFILTWIIKKKMKKREKTSGDKE